MEVALSCGCTVQRVQENRRSRNPSQRYAKRSWLPVSSSLGPPQVAAKTRGCLQLSSGSSSKAIPEIREIVLSALEYDPTLLSQTPATQMKALIVDPINQVPMDRLAKHPRLVIINGLDECSPPESQNDILDILLASLQRLKTPLYLLIASRPHTNIRYAFSSTAFRSIIHTIPLEHDYQST